MHTFLLCGYGVPRDIRVDNNYRTYLNTAFNRMFALVADQLALIIPSGGPTNCEPPFEGTEAQAMAMYLDELMRRPSMGSTTSHWRIIPETESLSTLENLLNTKRLIDSQIVGSLTIFCEATRRERLETLARKLFPAGAAVEAIDFDVSKNRYLDPDLLREKEQRATIESLWALEDPSRLARLHTFFERKFAYFRDRQSHGLSHVDVVEEWYRFKALELTRALLPDAPSS